MTSINIKDDTNKTIREKIVLCSPIRFHAGSNLPEQICSNCLEDLTVAYRFYSNCESTEAVLKSITENLISEASKKGQAVVKEQTGIKDEPEWAENEEEGEEVYEENSEEIYEDEQIDNEDIEFLERNFEEQETEVDDSAQKLEAGEENVPDGNPDAKYVISYVDGLLDENILEEHPIQMEQFHKVNTNKYRLGYTKNKEGVTSVDLEPGEVVQSEKADLKKVKREWVRHGNKTLKICEICGNSYKYQHALESHMRRHRGEKPFACSHCGKAFVIAFELKRHMRTHTGQKPYQCKYCERRFSDFGSRIKHERSHTGERPYVCGTCGKAFAYSHVLTSHNYIHTGEKKYGCDVCGKRFTKSHHLKAHSNIHSRTAVRRPGASNTGGGASNRNKIVPMVMSADGTVTIQNYSPDDHNLDQSMMNDMEVITIINSSGAKQEPSSDEDIHGMIIEQHVVGEDISVGGNESAEYEYQ